MFRYYAAVDAKKERTSKHAQSFGTKSTSHNTSASQVKITSGFSLTTSSCFMFSPPPPFSIFVSLPGPSGVAHSPALPVSAAADAGGRVHVLSDALRRERPLAGVHGPDHLHREGRDPLVLPEEPESTPGRRPTAASGRQRSCWLLDFMW